MATLTVRNVPDEVHKGLRLRAAQNGRSVEEEIRRILAEQVTPDAEYRNSKTPEEIAEAVKRIQDLFAPIRGKYSVDQFIAEKRATAILELAKFDNPKVGSRE
jgi:plasmid stability protein